METGAIVIGLVLLTAGLLFVIKPFNAKIRQGSIKTVARIKPDDGRVTALSALRDLDFDFRTGKVSEEDYVVLRARLVAEAAKYVDLEKEEDEKIEALIRARKSIATHENICGGCGAALEAGMRFCPHCGAEAGHVCPSCGETIKAGDSFCPSCGTRLEVRMEAMA